MSKSTAEEVGVEVEKNSAANETEMGIHMTLGWQEVHRPPRKRKRNDSARSGLRVPQRSVAQFMDRYRNRSCSTSQSKDGKVQMWAGRWQRSDGRRKLRT